MTEVIRCDGCRKILSHDTPMWEIVNTVNYRTDNNSFVEAVNAESHACSRQCLGIIGQVAGAVISGAKVRVSK